MKCDFHVTCVLAAAMPLKCFIRLIQTLYDGWCQILRLIVPGTKISPQLTGMWLYTPISYGLMVMSGYLIMHKC